MRKPADQPSRWPLVLAMVMLLGALGMLLWLRARLVNSQEAMLDGTVRRIEATGVLGRPESNAVVFQDIETLAQASESDVIRRLYITKRLLNGHEVCVLPFYADLENPDWRNEVNWLRLPVGDEPSGYVYLYVNNASLHAVTAGIALLGTLLAAGMGALLIRARGKEVQVGRLQTELEERKVQLLQLERLALAGQLSANIFHDIKKPVLNIKHEVSDALDEGTPPEDILRTIKAQTELFLQMLRELGMEAFVNASQQEQEWCDLAEAVERSLRLVRYEQGDVEVERRFDPSQEFLIQGVHHRLVQLFSNLILNAYQALNGTGKIIVEGKRTDGHFIVTMEDNGPGIPGERRAQIFTPFVTTRADSGGSGLGLFICRTIVVDMGGDIAIESGRELRGARFVITFPAGDET